MTRKYLAFLKKDLLVESSYKISFLLNIFGVFMSLLVYFFIDKTFGSRISGNLEEFGVNYFSYVLVGMAFFSYIGVGMGSFSERLREEQVQGTLEAILLTPTGISVLLFSWSLWNFCLATLDLLIYALMGIFLFNINFSHINIPSALITLLLIILSFSSLGIISASFIMLFKRGNPLAWLINNLEGLLGGVYFPITVLPSWLQIVANFFPITYAIRAIQLAVYKGYSPLRLSRELLFLAFFALMLLPLSLAVFTHSLKKARQNGSLIQY
jgi:ABC-2 type transport system permease protein